MIHSSLFDVVVENIFQILRPLTDTSAFFFFDNKFIDNFSPSFWPIGRGLFSMMSILPKSLSQLRGIKRWNEIKNGIKIRLLKKGKKMIKK